MFTLKELTEYVNMYRGFNDTTESQDKRDYASVVGKAILADAIENQSSLSRKIVKSYLDALDFYDGVENGARRRNWRARPYLSEGIAQRIENAALEDSALKAGL
jgi:hypothetical protein